MVKNYAPVIVFAFSKRECEALALQMSKLDFNTEEEQEMVGSVFMNAISALSDDDRKLPQIEHILPLLKRGIGIHHGGLLPILKEVRCVAFCFFVEAECLLYCTGHRDSLPRRVDQVSLCDRDFLHRQFSQTVSLDLANSQQGLNMPAKTVVFANVRKVNMCRLS